MAAAPAPAVRLTAAEIAAIRRIVAAHFGPAAEVRVFGSRARLDVRGGDLDLHVLVPGPRPPAAVEYRAIDEIMQAMDDLHVDLIVSTPAEEMAPIERTALRTGIRL
jgi:predicted nucleotidyltransferase